MSRKTNYYEVAFWQERYKQNICEWYEWLATPNQLASLVQAYIPNPSNILELGCGSSNFAEKLVALKHQAVTCLDFSKQVIKNKQKHAKEGITYKVHDILQPLPFEEGSFDAIIEKNTIDCLFCIEDFPAKVLRVMKECYRVLKEGGVMLSFSHGKQKLRRFFYRNLFAPFGLKVVPVQVTGQQPQIYLYILTKGDPQDAASGRRIEEQQHESESEGPQVQQQEHGLNSEGNEPEKVDEKQDEGQGLGQGQDRQQNQVEQDEAFQKKNDQEKQSSLKEENLQEQQQDYEFYEAQNDQ